MTVGSAFARLRHPPLGDFFLFRLELPQRAGRACRFGFGSWTFAPTLGHLFEGLDFFVGQAAVGTDGEFSQVERPDRNSFKASDFVADRGEDATDFPIASFGQDHFQDGPCPLFLLE